MVKTNVSIRAALIHKWRGGEEIMSDETMEQACCSCKWYAEFEGVCTNGESEYCADFTSSDDYCGLWEGIE